MRCASDCAHLPPSMHVCKWQIAVYLHCFQDMVYAIYWVIQMGKVLLQAFERKTLTEDIADDEDIPEEGSS